MLDLSSEVNLLEKRIPQLTYNLSYFEFAN